MTTLPGQIEHPLEQALIESTELWASVEHDNEFVEDCPAVIQAWKKESGIRKRSFVPEFINWKDSTFRSWSMYVLSAGLIYLSNRLLLTQQAPSKAAW